MCREFCLSIIITTLILALTTLIFFALRDSGRLEDCEHKTYRHVPIYNGKIMTTIVQADCEEEGAE